MTLPESEQAVALRPAPPQKYPRRWTTSALALALLLSVIPAAHAGAQALRLGEAAFRRQSYILAAQIFEPLAAEGNVLAETYLGSMYASGRGVPQNFEEAAGWYFYAARQGGLVAQFKLGLMYDKGQGVTQDYVAAYYWTNLAVAGASARDRAAWTRIRDAIASKLTLTERTEAQRLAVYPGPFSVVIP